MRATAKKRAQPLDKTLERVGRGQRIVLRKGRKAVAAVVSIEDLRLLEELEDRLDLAEAERRLADPKEVPLSYEAVRKELGLD